MTERARIPILVTYPDFEPWFRDTRSKFPFLEFRFCAAEREAVRKALAPDTEIFISEALPEPGPHLESLRWVHLFTSGYDYLLGQPLPKPDLLLTNCSGAMTDGMSEFVLMRMLMHARKAEAMVEAQRQREWRRNELEGTTLRGKRLLIIGNGSVGIEVARLAREFGMDVSIAGRADRDKLPDLVQDVNYLVIAASLNSSSRGLVNRSLLARMGARPYVVNISRGVILETTALLEAVRSGQVAGAALDVFDTEPLPPDSPLYTTPGISVSPHVSGVFEEVGRNLVKVFERNLACYLTQEPLPNRIHLNP